MQKFMWMYLGLLMTTHVSVAQAETVYVLNCPDQPTLISPKRLAWQKLGHEVVSHATSVSEELNFHVNRIARYSKVYARDIVDRFEGFERVQFRRGVTLQHDETGVPREINGCKTIILIRSSTASSYDHFGDQDTWNKLPVIDRMILGLRDNFLRTEWAGYLLSERLEGLTLQQYSRYRSNYALSYAGIDGLHNCSWYDQDTPATCKTAKSEIVLAAGQGILSGKKLVFGPQGNIREAHVESFTFLHHGMPYTGSGTAQFAEDGTLIWCEGVVIDGSGKVRLHHGGSFASTSYGSPVFGELAFNSLGKLTYGKLTSGYLSHLRDYLFIPESYMALHADGKLRAGFMKHESGQRYYLEANSRGVITRKFPFPQVRDFFSLKPVASLMHVKTEQEPKVVEVVARTHIPWKALIFNLETIFGSSSRCELVVDEATKDITIPAQCEVVFGLQALIQFKERD